MDYQRGSIFEYSVEDLDKELIARGAQIHDEKKFKFKGREVIPEQDAINYP